MNRTTFENSCDSTRNQLDAYVDLELTAEDAQLVRHHLETCGGCTREAETRMALKSRVRGVVRAQAAPPELAVKVRRRLSEQAVARPWWQLAAGAPKWVLSACALAVVATGVWVSRPEAPLPAIGDRPAQNQFIRRISDEVPGALRPGLADHVHCAVFRKYPADPPSVAVMLGELGIYHELLPAVEAAVPQSWRVVMAHQCSYMGRKYVHVTLREGQRLWSLVIARKQEGESFASLRPAATVNGVKVYKAKADRYQIAGFETAGYLAWVISDAGDTRNLEILSLLTGRVSRVLAKTL
jgi:anti-sigma factor (TIGR02949 family)